MIDKQYSTILTQVQDNILIVTLNRPEKRNALNAVLIKELHEILKTSKENKKFHGLILTGAGTAFCAGADLAYLESFLSKGYEEHLQDSQQLKELYFDLYKFPKPTMALVNGPAVAGGCGLVNVCDFAFSAAQAVFGYPEVKIGFVAALVSIFLVQSIGYRQAKNLLISGKLIDAQQAKESGLINDVISEESLLSYGLSFFKDLLNNSLISIQLSKRLLNETYGKYINELLNEACLFNAKARQEVDFKEGILAFLEKRKPQWEHLS
jgi:methylglutaconyl-CoA hydratase